MAKTHTIKQVVNSILLALGYLGAISFSPWSVAQASIDEISNYFALPMSLGTSGQPTVDQFTAIQAAGFDVVINLAMPDSDNALPNEGALVSENGMTYVHIPVPWEAPDANHLAQFFGVMDAMLAQNKKVWVHCAANYRASAFTYKYLTISQGLSEPQSTTPLLTKWLPYMDETWQGIMQITPSDIAVNSETP